MRYLLVIIWILCLSWQLNYGNGVNRLQSVMNGNNITVDVWNYGSFSHPGNRITNFVWNGLGYGYEFGFFVGGEVEVTAGSHPDIIFVTFDIENISEKPIEKALFGFQGDPHIGGPSDYSDDFASYDIERNMCYAWDADGSSIENPNITPGYMGIAFLQTPGNQSDGLDNDGDGMYDESPNDGIDNDNDWNSLYDDLGEDGIANTNVFE